MFWIGKYVGTHRARHFFTEIMEQRFDIHVVFRNKRVNLKGYCGTQLERMKSCDFLFVSFSWIRMFIIIIFWLVRANHWTLFYEPLSLCLAYWFLRMWPWDTPFQLVYQMSLKHWSKQNVIASRVRGTILCNILISMSGVFRGKRIKKDFAEVNSKQ